MSAWEFRVGQRVVCTYDDWDGGEEFERHPSKGGVYTIRRIEADDSSVWLLLDEIRNPEVQYNDAFGEVLFDARHFRPLRERKTSIECFRALLNPTDKKVDA